MDTILCNTCNEAKCRRCGRHILGPGEGRRKIEDGHPRGYRNIRFCFCDVATPLVVLVEGGIVQGVYVERGDPGRFTVVDSDDDIDPKFHCTGTQMTGTYNDLKAYSPEAYRLAVNEKEA